MKVEEMKKRLKTFERLEEEREILKQIVSYYGKDIIFRSDQSIFTLHGLDFPTVLNAMRSAATAELARIDAEIARLESDNFQMVNGTPPERAGGEFLVNTEEKWVVVYWGATHHGVGWYAREGFITTPILCYYRLPDAKAILSENKL